MKRTEAKQVSGQSKKWEDNILASRDASENYLNDAVHMHIRLHQIGGLCLC